MVSTGSQFEPKILYRMTRSFAPDAFSREELRVCLDRAATDLNYAALPEHERVESVRGIPFDIGRGHVSITADLKDDTVTALLAVRRPNYAEPAVLKCSERGDWLYQGHPVKPSSAIDMLHTTFPRHNFVTDLLSQQDKPIDPVTIYRILEELALRSRRAKTLAEYATTTVLCAEDGSYFNTSSSTISVACSSGKQINAFTVAYNATIDGGEVRKRLNVVSQPDRLGAALTMEGYDLPQIKRLLAHEYPAHSYATAIDALKRFRQEKLGN